jgi:hypothetical protein
MSNVNKRMDIYFDHRAPSIVVEVREYRNGYIGIRKRGGKIRAFTEITKNNINYCKELIKLVDELRNLCLRGITSLCIRCSKESLCKNGLSYFSAVYTI